MSQFFCQMCKKEDGYILPGGFIVCEQCFPNAVEAFNTAMELLGLEEEE